MNRTLPLLTFLSALAFALAPFLAENFAGFRPDQFPVPQDNPPVQPAGWAFAIWGLIYIWLILGTAYGAFRRAGHPDWARLWPWLLASLLPGVFWLELAQASFLWATALIWWMAVTAIAALFNAADRNRWMQRWPVSIYAGWLTAAASVSVGLALGGYGVLGPQTSAVVALLLILAIALPVQWSRPDAPGYGAAVTWALAGVAAANAGDGSLGLAVAAGVAALTVAGVALFKSAQTAHRPLP
ncbi:hypothetical protein [Mesobacterium pallidum]|uniref:hypothetical protein n=1 Tax=Mesobacterium pallidum TaxID=2872037 RepID=UPI001EE2F909|nr:hypothetical protein [Mesobacterium pallidum]